MVIEIFFVSIIRNLFFFCPFFLVCLLILVTILLKTSKLVCKLVASWQAGKLASQASKLASEQEALQASRKQLTSSQQEASKRASKKQARNKRRNKQSTRKKKQSKQGSLLIFSIFLDPSVSSTLPSASWQKFAGSLARLNTAGEAHIRPKHPKMIQRNLLA